MKGITDYAQTGQWEPGSDRMRWQARVVKKVNGKRVQRAQNFPHVDPSVDPTEGLAAAQQWRHDTIRQLETGAPAPLSRDEKQISLNEIWQDFRTIKATKGGRGGRGLAGNSLAALDNHWKQRVQPRFGEGPIRWITPTDVETWIATFGEKPAAEEQAFKLLRELTGYALRKGYIRVDPTVDADTGRPYRRADYSVNNHAGIALSKRQVHRLATTAGPDGLLVRFAAATGLRYGELQALQVSDLYLPGGSALDHKELNGVVTVTRSHSRIDGTKATKNTKARRVPIPHRIAADLRDHVKGRPADAHVFTTTKGNRLPDGWAKVAPRLDTRKRVRGTTGRGTGKMNVGERAPRKEGDTYTHIKREPFGRYVYASALAVHELQSALHVEPPEVDQDGRATYAGRTAEAVATWKMGEGRDDLDPFSLDHDDVSTLIGRPVQYDMQEGDADWQRPEDLQHHSELPDGYERRTFGIHDLRHTAATLALNAGVAPQYVQVILDHATAEFTLERYADANTAEGMRHVAAALDL